MGYFVYKLFELTYLRSLAFKSYYFKPRASLHFNFIRLIQFST